MLRTIKVESVLHFRRWGAAKSVSKIRLQGAWLSKVFAPGTRVIVENHLIDDQPALVLRSAKGDPQ